ncbi:MAG: hypothetical protein ETSY2_24270 [Candidatus Entotheonella gemina]|uniref:Uncharacterized protein n=1 Tax=Candidatus Entotheonella gemina TaxID=1429439 RepID=W4M6F0_9BACT|nr:MAG: hypothetical protein ETSY2_24270 [Candidatus Entotheonella gemina]
MWQDPIVEELHKIRADHAAQFNYDLQALVQHYQQEQRCSLRKMVSFTNRPTEDKPNAPQERIR